MGQRQFEPRDETDSLTVTQAVTRLGVDAVDDVARAAFDHAGELAALEFGRTAAVLGAVRLASRRSRHATLERERLATAFDADPDGIAGAEAVIASALTPPADAETIRTLRRQLIVTEELLAAAHAAGSSPSRRRTQQFGPAFADAAPYLLGRAEAASTRCDDAAPFGLDERGLRAHADRLRADLAFARLGTVLYRLVTAER